MGPGSRQFVNFSGAIDCWVQVVSWKGSIAKDQLIREKQKKHLLRRLDKPPYPPMLVYNKARVGPGGLEAAGCWCVIALGLQEGFPELTSDNYVKNHQAAAACCQIGNSLHRRGSLIANKETFAKSRWTMSAMRAAKLSATGVVAQFAGQGRKSAHHLAIATSISSCRRLRS